jgi:hypothetical protein
MLANRIDVFTDEKLVEEHSERRVGERLPNLVMIKPLNSVALINGRQSSFVEVRPFGRQLLQKIIS